MYEIWFTYNSARRSRSAETVERRDDAIEFFYSHPDITDMQVIEIDP